MMLQPQNLIMMAGVGLMLLGTVLFIWYPLGTCANPVTIMNVQFCITSPGSLCVLTGAALLIVGYLGMAYLSRGNG
jgi:hypothetical protein